MINYLGDEEELEEMTKSLEKEKKKLKSLCIYDSFLEGKILIVIEFCEKRIF
jgi:hypothetical protein